MMDNEWGKSWDKKMPKIKKQRRVDGKKKYKGGNLLSFAFLFMGY